MVSRGSFWLGRPSAARAALVLAWASLLALGLAGLAAEVSPLQARANLPLEKLGLREVYLTSLPEDPARVLLTTKRENSSWSRDMADQAGDPCWIRRYGDPARPGLSERILLTSRSRGARLLLPLGALDLERAFSAPDKAEPARATLVRSSLVQVFQDRSFAGVFLELRVSERAVPPPGELPAEPIDFDLVVVHGNQVRTCDFLLQPNGRFYRAAITEGLRPTGPLLWSPATDELVFALGAELDQPCQPLFVPFSLFDELELCWGAELPTIVDDRWMPAAFPAYGLVPPSTEVRSLLAWSGALQLAARLEDARERAALERSLARLVASLGRS